MKFTTPLLIVSLASNVALGWMLLSQAGSRTVSTPGEPRPAAAEASPAAIATKSAPPTEPRGAAVSPASAESIRDHLRSLGLPEEWVRAAVRAHIETPRLAKQRAYLAAQASQPWWRGLRPDALTADQTRELRELRKAERTELARLLGPAGTVTSEEVERFAYLPEDKAAKLAALHRDYMELRREVPIDADAPVNREQSQQREKLLKAEYERDLAALLTPEEREEFDLRTSNAAHSIGRNAKYFSATPEEFRAIYDTQKAYYDTMTAMEGTLFTERGQIMRAALEKQQAGMKTLLGAERYAQWQQSSRDEYRALVELQRRFSLPPATVAAVGALPRQISEEGLRITGDRERKPEERLAALRALADDARERVRRVLGADLGNAYNEAAARSWLDQLERGMVPVYGADGQVSYRMVGPLPPRTTTPRTTSPPSPPQR